MEITAICRHQCTTSLVWCGDGVAQVTLITQDFTKDITTALYNQMLLTQFVDWLWSWVIIVIWNQEEWYSDGWTVFSVSGFLEFQNCYHPQHFLYLCRKHTDEENNVAYIVNSLSKDTISRNVLLTFLLMYLTAIESSRSSFNFNDCRTVVNWKLMTVSNPSDQLISWPSSTASVPLSLPWQLTLLCYQFLADTELIKTVWCSLGHCRAWNMENLADVLTVATALMMMMMTCSPQYYSYM